MSQRLVVSKSSEVKVLKLAKKLLGFIFTAQSSYASAVFGIIILSVRPSVCLCFVTKQKNIQLKF